MSNSRAIIITGFMGSGKTTVAEALARMLKCSSVDLDQGITASDGRTPKDIIEQDGEQSFREVETRSLQDVLQSSATRVIALGGGAWTLERNRDLISEYGGITVWLDVPFEICWERILASRGERPLAPDRHRAQMLYAERRPNYARAQLHVVVSHEKSAEDISAEIAEELRTRNK
ncbi:MAG: AAA family ATPase [Acidobacteriota bacterium]|nr:AAA family ATPase [Acidobacteriota bacterium]